MSLTLLHKHTQLPLKSLLQKFYGRHHEFVDRYSLSICTMKTDLFNLSQFSFSLLSTPDLTFYEKLGGCFQENRGRLPYLCSWSMLQFLVELLIFFCCFVCMILITLCSLLCISVFHVWSLSMDYILLITAITLVPLITLL